MTTLTEPGTVQYTAPHSGAQQTTAMFPYLICTAILLSWAHCIFLSFPCLSSICFVHWDGTGGRQGLLQTALQAKCIFTGTKKTKSGLQPTHTHVCRLTNVPWHSYITRKLAKWINHGPCLALRALNGFSPRQVCPIIAFIHLVEARFTHLQRSCQSPGYIFRSGGGSMRRFVIRS